MAIRLVTGIPGSGKSYYCVTQITEKYCIEYGDVYALKSNIVLITNIDDLLLDSYSLDDMIKKAGSVEVFFTEEYQARVVEKFEGKAVVYVIDEAQKYFHRRFYDRNVFGFFETHRHLGLDVWLVSQNANLLARDILALVEYEVRAAPRTLTLFGFSYVRRSQGEVIGRHMLKKDKKVFNLYRSQSAEEAEKVTTPYVKYVALLAVCLFVGFGLFRATFASWGDKAGQQVAVIEQEEERPASVVVKQEEPEKTVLKKVSFICFESNLTLYDWTVGRFVPPELFSYPIIFDGSSRRILIYAKVPYSEFVAKKAKSSRQSSLPAKSVSNKASIYFR